MSKDSFVFYRDWFVAVDELDDSTRLEVYDAIMHEAFGFEKKELSSLASMAMKFVKPQIERDNDKYEAICRRNVENGKKGGRPKKTQENPQNPMGYLETQENPKNPEKPKKADNDNDIQDTNVSMSISNNIEKEEKDTNVSKKKEPTTELEKQFEAFRRKYKLYGGKVRGFETEFANLKNKHKDWKEIIPMLDYSIERENEERKSAIGRREFFAQMQNLQTYINQRSWERYSDGWDDYDPNGYHPSGMEYDAEFDAYRFFPCNPNYDLDDGYTTDNRPDGARIVEQINVYVWSKDQRLWIRQ